MSDLIAPFIHGFSLSLAMIIAIGAQNAFILKQGIKGQHVLAAAMTCALCDAFLIVVGAMGVGSFIAQSDSLQLATCVLGTAFLGFYAYNSFKQAWSPHHNHLLHAQTSTVSIQKIISMAIAFSILNPHAWLDTVVVIGSVSGQYEDTQKHLAFTIGACLVSTFWFFLLAYLAKKMRTLFLSPKFLRILDTAIGILMTTIALSLVYQGLKLIHLF